MNIAIVGAGPVGIYFAKLCLDKGYDVTLIESGNLNEESSHLNRKKYNFISPSAIPEGVHKIGGGSTQWRGRISEFLPEDFFKIYSGEEFKWPFDKTELDLHYRELYKFLGVGDLNDSEIIDKFFYDESEKISNDLLLRSFRFCKTDLFIELYNSIKSHLNFQILTGHFCYRISKNTLRDILSLELIPKNFDPIIKNFDKIVIACGTLQTTALLERSTALFINSENMVLGKYLTDHVEGYIGTVTVKKSKEKSFFKKISLNENNRAISNYEGIGVALSLKNVNHLNQLNVQYEFRNLISKPYVFAKAKNFDNYIDSKMPRFFNFLLMLERIIKFILRKCRKLLDNLLRINRYSIYIKSEEVPFINSTLYLDSSSQSNLVYSHKVKDETFSLLQESIYNFEKTFRNTFDASLKFYSETKNLSSLQNFFGPNWHPTGTARMGLDPLASVCNSNLQVHEIDNLYLLSAAVFPTASNTNPTFTVLALAHRLIGSDYFNS